MIDKDFFDWLKTKQSSGKITQRQVDGGAELLAVVKPDVLQECLAKIKTYADGFTLNTLDSKVRETKNYEMNYGSHIVRKSVNGGLNGYVEFCQTLEKCLKHL